MLLMQTAVFRRVVRPLRAPVRGAVLSAMLLVFTAVGCRDAAAPPARSSADTVPSGGIDRDACRARLEAAISRLPPDSLAAITNLDGNVGALNAWLVECAADEVAGLTVSEQNLAFFDASARRAITSPRFTARDVAWVRDALISARLAQAVTSRAEENGADSEAVRIIRLFEWVGASLSLQMPEEADVPRGYLDFLLSGRGPLEARVWVFAVLLRQLQRDVVLLSPDEQADPAATAMLAVCLDDRMLLFDPRSWMPVAVDGDQTVFPDDTAGADWIRNRSGWQNVHAAIIAETSAVCPRMLVLQGQLPASSAAVLYEEIAGGTSPIRPLIERVTAASSGLLDASRMHWWSWPDEQINRFTAAQESERRTYTALMKHFEAPFEREPLQLDADFQELLSRPDLSAQQRDALWTQRWQMEYQRMEELRASGDMNKLFGRPSGRLLAVRLEQIQGRSDRSVIQRLQRVRTACMDDAIQMRVPTTIDPSGIRSIPIPEAIQNVNRQATGDALYWTALCQIDRRQPGTAITSLQSYRRQYPDGRWFYPSFLNQARALLMQGRTEDAVRILTQADAEANPDRAHVQALLKRIRRLLSDSEAEANAESPADADTPAEAGDGAGEPTSGLPDDADGGSDGDSQQPAEPSDSEPKPTSAAGESAD